MRRPGACWSTQCQGLTGVQPWTSREPQGDLPAITGRPPPTAGRKAPIHGQARAFSALRLRLLICIIGK